MYFFFQHLWPAVSWNHDLPAYVAYNFPNFTGKVKKSDWFKETAPHRPIPKYTPDGTANSTHRIGKTFHLACLLGFNNYPL